ncbi:hypothetical protein V8E54_000299 [Elaphomyces granulatus]
MSTRRLVPSAIGKQQIRRGKLLTKKENITTQQRLEKNILRWVVTSKQPFTVVQDPDFKQIFLSLATHDRSVARCNSLPILAIIGHWLMEFEYRQQQQVIEFTELQGPHSSENLAATVDPGIGPCSPIAGANAGNSETVFSNLHRRLPARIGLRRKRKRRDSYIQYLGHVLESDKGILRSLGSGSKIVY